MNKRSIYALAFLAMGIAVAQAQSCSSYEYYDVNATTCKSCSSFDTNCNECNWDTTTKMPICNRCKDKYYVNATTGSKCSACATNCAICDGPEPNNCIQVDWTYKLNPVMNAIHKCNGYSCKYCNADSVCEKCEYGYKPSTSDKASCTSCYIGGCGSCTTVPGSTTDVCTSCKSGYYLKALTATTQTCASCPSNCIHCLADKTCEQCEAGYIWNAVGGTCTKCSDNCLKCSSTTTCEICSIGYWWDTATSKCINTCSLQACTRCADSKTCAQCNSGTSSSGFTLIEGQCQKCDDNCAVCSKTACTACNPGYILGTDGKCTEKCTDSYCYNCTNANKTCTQCLPNYMFVTRTSGQVCQSPYSRCSSFQLLNRTDSCNKANETWKLNMTFCRYGDADTPQCTDIVPGYYWDPVNKSTLSCPGMCTKCVWDPVGMGPTCTDVSQAGAIIVTDANKRYTAGYFCPAGCKCGKSDGCTECRAGFDRWLYLKNSSTACVRQDVKCPLAGYTTGTSTTIGSYQCLDNSAPPKTYAAKLVYGLSLIAAIVLVILN